MNKVFIVVALFFLANTYYGQGIKVNKDVDTNLYEFGEPLKLWLNFLNSENDSVASQYWNKAEIEKYGAQNYFQVENVFDFGTKNYHRIIRVSDIIILSITKNEGLFKIKSSLAFPLKDSLVSSVMYVFNVYAKVENGSLKLYNALEINEKLFMGNSTMGKVKFYYPKYHLFNDSLGKKQADFLEKFGNDFGVPVDSVSWYFAETNEELQRMKGFDYLYGETTNNVPSGRADVINRRAFGAGMGEYYPHELIHVLINPHYPNNHLWFNEGLCTFYGGSRGYELEWHLKRMTKFLYNHPEIDLDSMLQLRNMDNLTGYRYALGGFLMKMAFEKGGVDLQKKLLKSGRSNDDFYKAVDQYLGIKQDNLNEVIRKKLYEAYL